MVSQIPRRTLDELITLYTLEPDIADFYVEGRTDRAFLEYVAAHDSAQVIEIDAVDVPASYLGELALSPGARDRVIGLASSLQEAFGSADGFKVRCIIDSDLDRILDRHPPQSDFLLVTDFSCLEAYWFDHEHLMKYRKVGLHDAGDLKNVDLLDAVTDVLRECFLLRAAAETLRLSLAWVDPMKSCVVRNGIVEFDRDDFLAKWLNKNGSHSQKGSLVNEVEKLRKNLPSDRRHYIHGHDLTKMIAWYVRPHVATNQLAHPEVVSRMLACCCERQKMLEHTMLETLAKIAGSTSQ
jgi:hypothetical protein